MDQIIGHRHAPGGISSKLHDYYKASVAAEAMEGAYVPAHQALGRGIRKHSGTATPFPSEKTTVKTDGVKVGALNVVMAGRNCGKSMSIRAFYDDVIDRHARFVKGHHRCYCGSGKLRKNCCNKRLPSDRRY